MSEAYCNLVGKTIRDCEFGLGKLRLFFTDGSTAEVNPDVEEGCTPDIRLTYTASEDDNHHPMRSGFMRS